MKELLTQWNGKTYTPWSDPDKEESREFKVNQLVRIKAYGVDKDRSLVQLQRYWVICGKMAELLSDHTRQYTREDIDFEVKIKVAKQHPSMIKRFKLVDGIVYMQPISIAFRNLKHIAACRYFDIAFQVMEDMAGTTIDNLLGNVG